MLGANGKGMLLIPSQQTVVRLIEACLPLYIVTRLKAGATGKGNTKQSK